MSMLDGFEEYMHSEYEDIVLESLENDYFDFDLALESAADKFVGLSPEDEEEILNGNWENDEIPEMDNIDLSDDENFEPDDDVEECGTMDSYTNSNALMDLLDEDYEYEALENFVASIESSNETDDGKKDDLGDDVEECGWYDDCDDECDDDSFNNLDDDFNDDTKYFDYDDDDNDDDDDEDYDDDEECSTESDISLESLLDDISRL